MSGPVDPVDLLFAIAAFAASEWIGVTYVRMPEVARRAGRFSRNAPGIDRIGWIHDDGQSRNSR